MIRWIICSLLVILPSISCNAAIYRWVDQGVTTFSDQPHPGATKITLAPLQLYQASPLLNNSPAAINTKALPNALAIKSQP